MHCSCPLQVYLIRERNLFHLFFTNNYLETVCHWTVEDLGMKGKRPCSAVEFYAYIGLELGPF